MRRPLASRPGRARRPLPPPAGPATVTEWWWPPSPTIFRTIPAGYASFEHLVVPELDPSPAQYAWGHEFAFVGGRRGWVGLRSGDKAAVFQVFGAVDATGPGAAADDTPEPGWSCTRPVPWEAGRAYRLRVWTEVDGWWSADVAEEGREPEVVGHVRVPGDWRRLASRSMAFSEYRGPPLARGTDLAPSCVIFSVPTADAATLPVLPVRRENLTGPGAFGGAQIDDLGGGVRHRMGGT